MNIPELNFSNFAVYWTVILAFIILILLRAARFFIPVILPKKNNRNRVIKYFPVFELLIWMFYSIWSIQFFIKNNQFFAFFEMVIFLLSGVLIFWLVLRDYFSGLLFRLENKLQKGDTIQLKHLSGTITELGNRKIEIETTHGKKALIPYSSIFSDIIIKDDNVEMISSHQFRVQLNNLQDTDQFLELTKRKIMALPWSSLKKTPTLHIISENNNRITVEITVYPIDKKYFYQIEQAIKNDFSLLQ